MLPLSYGIMMRGSYDVFREKPGTQENDPGIYQPMLSLYIIKYNNNFSSFFIQDAS